MIGFTTLLRSDKDNLKEAVDGGFEFVKLADSTMIASCFDD